MISTEESVENLLRTRYKPDMESYLSNERWGSDPPALFGIDLATSNTVVSYVTVDNYPGV